MKYIRIKDGICDLSTLYIPNCNLLKTNYKKLYDKLMSEKIKEADTIEELVQIGDLIVWYNTSSKRYEYFYIHDNNELEIARMYPIVEIYAKNNKDFVLIASNEHTIKDDNGWKQLIKGEWKLI